VCLRVALVLRAVVGTSIAACYDVPRPDCGFVCGPDGACPEGYTCANDHRCHRIGAPANLMCGPPPVDAAVDSPVDAS
jgi:hypothetical protein